MQGAEGAGVYRPIAPGAGMHAARCLKVESDMNGDRRRALAGPAKREGRE